MGIYSTWVDKALAVTGMSKEEDFADCGKSTGLINNVNDDSVPACAKPVTLYQVYLNRQYHCYFLRYLHRRVVKE